ncbi:efflux transporter, RND family, MFP subunit [Methylobacterium sp. 4-46]|uniref:efflux RND transporter periplasmic adaptor subunit n=1 Tax=unclassified Methylobacterium TaxID=2615210 RepID=UPI000152DE86|nr:MULTISPECIES: efflux RND transporter periplasmic adaptor subunit [Methylobacterium]ACA17190.1 efflux transporter, RND family, MFP subunit [Methylobacterium sp. 4-46]WFT82872.1 efflux RND transporter periplasmic adaptor subunit [Methylobacterium nodulans]
MARPLVTPIRLAAALGWLALAGCDEQKAPAAGEGSGARPVLVQRATFEDRVPSRTFVGTIRPRIESDLGFRVQGKIETRLVNVGDVVRAGQPLARLDEVDLRLQTEQAQAELAAATASLAQAEADLRRTATLAVQGWSAAASLDRQKAAAEEARGRLLRAERALMLARNAVSYAVLAADADGVVTAALVEPGQVVAPGQAAIRLARTAEKEAVIAVPEALIGQVREGAATVGLWSDPKAKLAARLRELAPAADAATRTYLARFSLPDADARVQLGMTATVTLSGASAERIVRVPLSALYNQGGGPAVWTVDEAGGLSLKPVSVAAYEAQDALVAGGLAEGERFVRLGVHKLDAGQRVRVVDALRF